MVNVQIDGDCYQACCQECGEQFELPISDLRGILRSVPDDVFLRHSLKCVCELTDNSGKTEAQSVHA